MSEEENLELAVANQDELFEREIDAALQDVVAFNTEARKRLETTRSQGVNIQSQGELEQTRLNTTIEAELNALDRAVSAD